MSKSTTATAALPVVSRKPNALPKRRVLVVDDDLDSVNSMAVLLKMMGQEARFAVNSLAAIGVVRSFRPEVILLDIRLPGFNGNDVASQLRYEPGMERTRIIAMTACSNSEDRQRALDAGCTDYFVKPLHPETLQALLEKP